MNKQHAPGTYRLLDLRPRQCRFACAETPAGQHLFCGEVTTAPGKPWCEAHHAVVFEAYRRGGHALAEHKGRAA